MDKNIVADALKSVMRQRRWSQARLGRELGVSQVWVCRIVNGQGDPGFHKVTRLLGRVGLEVHITSKQEETDPVKRRKFLTTVASVSFVPKVSVTPYQDPEYVRALATRLGEDLYDHGGVPILPIALRHARQLEPVLTGTDRALQSAASDLATWAAWIARDAGRFDIAEHVGRLALSLGKHAADQEAQAAACSALTETNISRNRLDHAVMYARQAMALQEITPERRAWLKMRLGRALALLGGEEHAAREALEDAQSFVGLPSVDAADMAVSVGMGFSDLRAYGEAYASLDEAVRLSESCSPLVCGYGLAKQAQTALSAADPSFAADRMFALARVIPIISSSWIDKNVSELLPLSAPWAMVPEIRAAREQLRSLSP